MILIVNCNSFIAAESTPRNHAGGVHTTATSRNQLVAIATCMDLGRFDSVIGSFILSCSLSKRTFAQRLQGRGEVMNLHDYASV